MPSVSIITCVSRPEVYEKCLLKSINKNRGDHDIEIIPIWNNDNRYSASNALNIGIDVARSDVLVFAHQDITLLDGWFDHLFLAMAKLPSDYGILGAAGISLDYGRKDVGRWGGALNVDTVAIGSVWDADENLSKPPYWDGTKEVVRAHCADECLFVLNRKTGLRFDPHFTGFHFYGVDLCLQARATAYGVYCGHLPLIHYGKYSASFVGHTQYWVYLRLLYNKWRLRFPELLGTHMHWSDGFLNDNGDFITQPELTSYINLTLEEAGGQSIGIRSLGIGKVKMATDKHHGLY